MRACHVVYSYYPFDPRVRKEVEALADAGHDMDVIAIQDEGEAREEVVRGVRVHRVPLELIRGGKSRYLYQYALFFLMASAILLVLHLRRRFHVIHVHSLPDFQVFCSVPERILGAKSVLDLHEAMPEILAARFRLPMTSPWVRLARSLEWTSCAYSNRVVVVNRMRERLIVSRGVEASKIVVVMNSPDAVPDPLPPVDGLRKELGLDGRVVIVHAGGLNEERDLETLIEAAARLNESIPVSLLLFGKGDAGYRERLSRLAAASEGLDVRVGGWISPEAAFRHLCLSTIGVATYEKNPLTEYAAPHKVLELVAAGKPLILADLAGLREVWGAAALYYEPGNAADLAGRIEQVLGDPQLSESLRAAARPVYEASHWSHSRDALVRMYASMSGG